MPPPPPVSALVPAASVTAVDKGRIALTVNGAARQEGDLSEMIWAVPEIIAELRRFITLLPGDLIFTDTPAAGAGWTAHPAIPVGRETGAGKTGPARGENPGGGLVCFASYRPRWTAFQQARHRVLIAGTPLGTGFSASGWTSFVHGRGQLLHVGPS